MPRKSGAINKSQAIRDLIAGNPKITAQEAIETLRAKGIKIGNNLFYFNKGKMKGRKSRRRKMRRKVAAVMGANGAVASTGAGDVLATIRKVKGLASELGGLKKLKALVEALSE